MLVKLTSPERAAQRMAFNGRHHQAGRDTDHGRVGNPLLGRR
jgi:hypothetical protein